MALIAYFIKSLGGMYHYFFFVFLRFLAPFLLLMPFFIFNGTFKHLHENADKRVQFARALTMVLSQYAAFIYLMHGSLFNSAMLFQSAAIFMTLISWWLLGHRVTTMGIFSLVMGIIGIAFVLKPDTRIFDPWGIFGLLAGFFFGLSQVFYGMGRKRQRADVNLFYLFFITSALCGIVFLFAKHFVQPPNGLTIASFSQIHEKALIGLLGIAVCTIGNQALRGEAYFYVQPSSLAPFNFMNVLFAAFIDWYAFGTVPDRLAIFGAILVLFSVLLKLFTPSEQRVGIR